VLGEVKNAHSRNARGGCARSECHGVDARCSTGIEHGTSDDGSGAGDRQSVGWLWLGLAPDTRPLEPVGSMGFHRTARRTIMGGGVPMRGGEVPTVSIAVGVPTGIGKLLTAVAFTGRTRSRLS
jgi:hypothetical protein